MTQTKLNKSLKQLFRRSNATKSSSKAYLRNFGKGGIDFADGTLKFYLSKGKMLKQKELAKTIASTEIEEIALDNNELTVTGKNSTDRFIIEDATAAKNIAAKINELLKLRTQPPAEQIAIDAVRQNKMASDKASAIKMDEAMAFIDSLFDVLLSLVGIVNWSNMKNRTAYAVENLKTLSEIPAFAELNLCSLSSAIDDRDIEQVKSTCLNLLESVYTKIEENAQKNGSQQLSQTDPSGMEILQSYFILNNIILGSAVRDEKIDDEVQLLDSSLRKLSEKTNVQIDVDIIINSTIELVKTNKSNGKGLRSAFKKQLNPKRPIEAQSPVLKQLQT